jgi:uncharacterized protein DUF1761
MRYSLLHLNYLSLLVTTLVGFLLGWLWYSPVLFVKPWMAEMKFTEESMNAAMAKGVAQYFIRGFGLTLLSTFGLAMLITARMLPNWKHGAAFGAFVGLFVVSTRILNGYNWENRSLKLQWINAGHEIALFTLQGAILGAWH